MRQIWTEDAVRPVDVLYLILIDCIIEFETFRKISEVAKDNLLAEIQEGESLYVSFMNKDTGWKSLFIVPTEKIAEMKTYLMNQPNYQVMDWFVGKSPSHTTGVSSLHLCLIADMVGYAMHTWGISDVQALKMDLYWRSLAVSHRAVNPDLFNSILLVI